MPTIQSAIQNPRFQQMSQQGQIETLKLLDSNFAALSPQAQGLTMQELFKRQQLIDTQQPASQPRQTFNQKIFEQAPRVLGGIAGGLAAVPGIFTTPAGVALGAAGAEALRQVVQQIMGDPKAPKSSKAAATEITKAGITEGAFELGGGLATRGVMKVLAPFAKKVTPQALNVINKFKSKMKPFLTPAEATESRVLDILENVSENSLVGGGKFSQFKVKRQVILDDVADDLIDQFGRRSTPEEFGQLFVDAVDGKIAARKPIVNMLYNNAEQLAGDVSISTASLKKFAEPLAEVAQEIGGIEAANAGDDVIRAILDLPDTISFATAKEVRSRLLSKVNEFSIVNKKAPAIGKSNKLIHLIDQAVESALTIRGSEALRAWRTANRFFKEGQEQFNNTMIRKLLKRADDTGLGVETIGKALFKPGNVTGIKKVMKVLNPKEADTLRGFFTSDLLQKSADKNGIIMGTRLLNNLSGKPGSFGEPMLKQIYTPQQLESIKDFANALNLSQQQQSGGLGSMFIQLSQAGAVVGFATGFEPEATAILLGPALLSRAMLSRPIARMLTEGIKLPARSPQAVGVMTRLTAAILRLKDNKEIIQ